MARYRKNEYRKVIQETFKGYGKGFSLLTLVAKGMSMDVSPAYFIMVLIIRGSASSLYKQLSLSLLIKKKFKMNKPIINFIFNTCPTICVYVMYITLRRYTHKHFAIEFEKHITPIFVTYMVLYRSIRAVTTQIRAA